MPADESNAVFYCETCGQALPRSGGALGDFIRSKRTARHLTLRDVERISEGRISNAYLSQLETGRVTDPSASMLLVICAALGVDIDDMLSIIDPLYLPHRKREPRTPAGRAALKASADD